MSSKLRYSLRYLGIGVVLIIVAVPAIAWYTLRASLPQLSGAVTTTSPLLVGASSIERDAEGTPTIKAASRSDLAFATGFAHAQDRFFQMDLMRRAAAGELSELLGSATVETDKKLRVHDFRRVSAEVIATSDPAERSIVEAYAAGVNAGLASLQSRPWEYHLLRSTPRPWKAEDSLLVAFSMYLNLNDSSGQTERAMTVLHDALPADVFAFLHQFGTSWDAPMTGGTWKSPPIPGPEVFDLHNTKPRKPVDPDEVFTSDEVVGSNSWAVAGSHAADGRALLANDMHLGLRLPHVWYRARLIVTAQGAEKRDMVGVTLPGLPMLIVGSNGHVAWGFTNSYGDWADVVIAEADSTQKDYYLYADTSEPYRVRHETILVRGAAPVLLKVRMTRWGPVIDRDAKGTSSVLMWTAHQVRASNLHLLQIEAAGNIDAAMGAANRSGGPVQNFVVADSDGHIGWTLMGQVPVRSPYDPSLARSMRDTTAGWIGWRTPEEYPRLIDPPSGRLWTANARTIDVESWLDFFGDGEYDLGARASQIRDDLLAIDKATVDDMRKIQLDDRALFLVRWHDLLLSLLSKEAVDANPRRAEALKLIAAWSQRAAVDDVGYRVVRAFRSRVRDDVFDMLVGDIIEKHPNLEFTLPSQFEGPLWQLVTQRPMNMLSPQFKTWDEALLHSLDRALEILVEECGDLNSCTWGRQNTLAMSHPMSKAVPWLSRVLDMPPLELPGDAAMPRVQGPAFGASERLVVSPGRESEGILQMPGGPVDHPLSPFYGAGHEAWTKGDAQPLLPGETKYTLQLVPAR